jgi:hypothetical protein
MQKYTPCPSHLKRKITEPLPIEHKLGVIFPDTVGLQYPSRITYLVFLVTKQDLVIKERSRLGRYLNLRIYQHVDDDLRHMETTRKLWFLHFSIIEII